MWITQQPDYLGFTDERFILPSIKITYGACQDVKIEVVTDHLSFKEFKVTYKQDGKTETDYLKFRGIAVLDAPSHL